MFRNKLFSPAVVAAAGFAIVIASIAIAESAKDTKPAGHPEMKLPEGWTEEDMQACVKAGTPGEMHAYLAAKAGEWQGKGQMWMGPDTDPMPYECVQTIDVIMDGRFIKCEFKGELPGMGPFHGVGYNGFDNVSQQFVSTWIDNCGTGIMTGNGERSSDGKTLTWSYTFNCPMTKRPAKMKEIDQFTGKDTMTMDMFMNDPKSGKEYKMMSVTFTRTS